MTKYTKYILTICLYIEKGFDNEGIYKFVGNKYFDKVQIIIVDSYNNGKISDFASKYENMIYLNSNNSDISYCYNMCKDYIEGEYINYTSNIYSFCQSSLDNIIDYLLKNDKLVVCTRLSTIEKEEKIHLKKPMRTEEYILLERLLPFPLTISIFFVKKSITDDINFNSFYNKYSPTFFLFDLYKKITVIDYLLDAYVLSKVPLENDHNLYLDQREKNWYLDFYNIYMRKYLENSNPLDLTSSINQVIIYTIQRRIFCNYNARDKFVLNQEEIKLFYQYVKDILQYIDNQDILDSRKSKMIPKFFSYLLYELKLSDFSLYNEIKENELGEKCFYHNNDLIGSIELLKIDIKAINYKNGEYTFDAILLGGHLVNVDDIQLHIKQNNEDVPFVRNNIYSLKKVFGKTVKNEYTFSFKISAVKLPINIEFYYEFENYCHKLKCTFSGTHSKINHKKKYSYWVIDKKILTYSKDERKISINKNNFVIHFIKEIQYLFSLKNSLKQKSRIPKLVFLRICYWLTLPIYGNNEIWLMYDKLYKGGDNGEYFFRYCMDKNDGYQNYYILNKTASGFENLSKEYGKNVVEFNSLKNKILTLHATRIFSTHANVYRYCGISKSFLPYVKDLLNSDNYCLQHGLTIQKIAQYQNRLEDNLKLYFCSSKYEIENLRHPVYGFEDNQLLLTGSPRYDGLKNNDQKQILITPTWRRNIVITGNKFGTSKDYNDQFKNTVYFDIYDSLINDKRLIDTAKEHGYKIVYLLHPVMSSQINDFHIQDGVEIVAATSDMSYEKILTESSLMVTDYSGVQFDFAYQKKPVLYYHPDRLPPQYDESCFKYDTMGFGPILESHNEIVDSLCEYMKNQCQMKAEYITRVDEFFAYSDFNNSKRIYENVIEFIKNE